MYSEEPYNLSLGATYRAFWNDMINILLCLYLSSNDITSDLEKKKSNFWSNSNVRRRSYGITENWICDPGIKIQF